VAIRVISNVSGRHYRFRLIYEEFIRNAGEVDITEDEVKIFLKKKRTLPAVLTAMQNFAEQKYLGLKNKKLIFFGSTTS